MQQHYAATKMTNIFKAVTIVTTYKKLQSQPAFTYSKLTIETLEQGVKYVQN